MHIDRTGERRRAVFPHTSEQVDLRQRRARVLDEEAEQLEFPRGEVDDFPVLRDFGAPQVDTDGAERDRFTLGRGL